MKDDSGDFTFLDYLLIAAIGLFALFDKVRPMLWLLTKAAFTFVIIYVLFIAPQ